MKFGNNKLHENRDTNIFKNWLLCPFFKRDWLNLLSSYGWWEWTAHGAVNRGGGLSRGIEGNPFREAGLGYPDSVFPDQT